MKYLKQLVNNPAYVILIAIMMILASVLPTVILSRDKTKQIELALHSELSLLVDDPLFSELSIRYKDQEIQDLTKLSFRLTNTGKLPILPESVETYPTLTFDTSVRFLLPRIVDTVPKGIESRVMITGLSGIQVVFGLLNSGDEITFCVYTSGLRNSVPTIIARIAGISSVDFVDYRTTTKVSPSYVSAGVRAYLIISVILLFASLSVVGELRTERRIRATLTETPDYIETIESERELEQFIRKDLEFLAAGEKRELRTISSNEDAAFAERRSDVNSRVTKMLQSVSAVKAGFITCIVVALIGFFFYFWEFTH